jgi:glycosyltransferase involved in cell wall biosynthesis
MTENDITVVIPSIPVRPHLLERAIGSVARQTLPAAAISIAVDTHREGAAATRQRALDAVTTPWVAFLDDDDMFKNEHLERLLAHALETEADFVYSWFEMLGGGDPFPSTHFTEPFDPENPIETTITTLVRTELAKQVGFQALNRGHNINSGEDRFFTLGCLAAGAKISHLVERTWFWCHHLGNTSGLPTKW